jgi:hypothetical protein
MCVQCWKAENGMWQHVRLHTSKGHAWHRRTDVHVCAPQHVSGHGGKHGLGAPQHGFGAPQHVSGHGGKHGLGAPMCMPTKRGGGMCMYV